MLGHCLVQTPPSFTLGDLRRGGSPADISLTDSAGLGVERQEQANLHSIERAQLKPVGRYLLHTAQSYLETYHKSHEQDGKTFQDIPTKRGIISRIVCWEGPKDVLALESSEISDVLHQTMMNSTATAIDANEVTSSTFDNTYQEVFTVLERDMYKRFVLSPLYRELATQFFWQQQSGSFKKQKAEGRV